MERKNWLWAIAIVVALVIGVIVGAVWTGKKLVSGVVDAIHMEQTVSNNIPNTCKSVEALLNGRLAAYDEKSLAADDHVWRAQIYANISKRGCPENAERYKALALHEIEIARALDDDENFSDYEVMEVVDTYKKLDMEDEARMFIDTIKRIAAPAVEFIQAVEKVLEEGN